jgi:hypothetical protein
VRVDRHIQHRCDQADDKAIKAENKHLLMRSVSPASKGDLSKGWVFGSIAQPFEEAQRVKLTFYALTPATCRAAWANLLSTVMPLAAFIRPTLRRDRLSRFQRSIRGPQDTPFTGRVQATAAAPGAWRCWRRRASPHRGSAAWLPLGSRLLLEVDVPSTDDNGRGQGIPEVSRIAPSRPTSRYGGRDRSIYRGRGNKSRAWDRFSCYLSDLVTRRQF